MYQMSQIARAKPTQNIFIYLSSFLQLGTVVQYHLNKIFWPSTTFTIAPNKEKYFSPPLLRFIQSIYIQNGDLLPHKKYRALDKSEPNVSVLSRVYIKWSIKSLWVLECATVCLVNLTKATGDNWFCHCFPKDTVGYIVWLKNPIFLYHKMYRTKNYKAYHLEKKKQHIISCGRKP